MGTSGMSRRDFLRIGGGAGAGLFFIGQIGGVPFKIPVAAAQIPGGTLDPDDVRQVRQTPMLIPPVMPRAGTITMPGGKPADYYEISMRQISQQILPAGMPATTVWGYGAVKSASQQGAAAAPRALAHDRVDVEAAGADQVDQRAGGRQRQLPAAPAAGGPDAALGQPARRRRRAATRGRRSTSTPGRYTGPVPIVTHLHGAAGVGDESDGYAEAWYLPAANNIPAGYATEGTWYDFFAGKAASKFAVAWGPGFATFQYPNDQRESTLWYHDHALGMTRLNVYAGPAGFFLVRGGPEGDKAVLDSRTGTTAVLPSPAPNEGDKFPPNKTYYEIPIAVQDRSFNTDGSLFYPDTRAFFDGYAGPYIPETDVSPIWNPEFFGNMIMVNGNTWPFQTVEQRRYRLRFLNGCQSRFLILDFSNIPGVEVWQIGNEGGFLAAPVNLTADQRQPAADGPGRAGRPDRRLHQRAGGQPRPRQRRPRRAVRRREPGRGLRRRRPRHAPARSCSSGSCPRWRPTRPRRRSSWCCRPSPASPAARPGRWRCWRRRRSSPTGRPRPSWASSHRDGTPESTKEWMDPVTENPAVGATEVWEYYNATADAHPMHIHEVAFQVVNRQGLAVDEDGEVIQPVQLVGSPTPPESWENGWKDTVIAYPGQVTRLRLRFTNPGQFVWHCHIVEHEDNEMMRPYRIGPVQPGQPPDQPE